ncbi:MULTISPECIES: carbohydrate ABC transporter permease [Paenibacillus]|uniref:Carbohydrate ABC transporter permease n=2 Tax=Paenibacillus TaxID=44249 RepID=A0ABX2DW99_9BACL|nr:MULTISPECIES: carbohydrate ABC transporter permease [Paenibacillus]AIQ32360.1 ABC transporter permease [Paenibacillus sp. FSL P4-0081]NQX48983.1 carbohydrate ABC transporter permease [Paenibacillus tritici]OMF21530.1 ABC transporter permease [Paenibacillus sp. FSL H8-0259]QUL54210.1 carbohydrate ABC transporter permease [Paenibacillus tritici]
MKYRLNGSTVFAVFNKVFLILLGILCIAPIVNTLAISFSSASAVAMGKVRFFPSDFSLDAYKFIATRPEFLRSLGVAVIRVLVGSALQMLVTFISAYPLSRENRDFSMRTFYVWFFMFTILFSGGIVPLYMQVKSLHMLDTMMVLVLPTALAVFNIVLMINFFRGLPRELDESFRIDGAGHWTILWRLYFPLSLPAFATILLLAMVGHWNSWFDGMIFMNQTENYPLATYLRSIIVSFDFSNVRSEDAALLASISPRTTKSAQIILATLPILCVYPFLQRYFVSGLVLGSVKG